MKRIFLIDGNSLANRAFYALPFLTNLKGEPSGAVYGFANLLINLEAVFFHTAKHLDQRKFAIIQDFI